MKSLSKTILSRFFLFIVVDLVLVQGIRGQTNPQYSPLATENKNLLFNSLIKKYDNRYKKAHKIQEFDANEVYFLRDRLQSLIDMWLSTNNIKYLLEAKNLTLSAINFAQKDNRTLIFSNQNIGSWPCFYSDSLSKITGGHGQLYDLQAASGFMLVANALYNIKNQDYILIADFVEKYIIQKWIIYKSLLNSFQTNSISAPLYFIDNSRDKRVVFASVCLDLHKINRNTYPYFNWANMLIDIYLKADLAYYINKYDLPSKSIPHDAGILLQNNCYIWYWTNKIIIQDTSHANRSVWLATQAYNENLLTSKELRFFINTLKYNVWSPANGIFYFKNSIDGTDPTVQKLGPGRKGNIWFGWHCLFAYDEELKNLFLSMAYDLTNAGSNFPPKTQNQFTENGPLCIIAWSCRLISNKTTP